MTYSAQQKSQISAIAQALVTGMIENGEIDCTDEAIRAVMPQVVRDATQVVNAVDEYLCG